MSIPAFCAARMIVSPASKGISRSSILKVGIRISESLSECDSTVAFTTDHVQGAEARYDVGHHGTGGHALGAGGDQETRRANAHAVRSAAAIAHQVKAELAVAAFAVGV